MNGRRTYSSAVKRDAVYADGVAGHMHQQPAETHLLLENRSHASAFSSDTASVRLQLTFISSQQAHTLHRLQFMVISSQQEHSLCLRAGHLHQQPAEAGDGSHAGGG